MRHILSPVPATARERAVAATLCVLIFLECLTLLVSLIWLLSRPREAPREGPRSRLRPGSDS